MASFPFLTPRLILLESQRNAGGLSRDEIRGGGEASGGWVDGGRVGGEALVPLQGGPLGYGAADGADDDLVAYADRAARQATTEARSARRLITPEADCPLSPPSNPPTLTPPPTPTPNPMQNPIPNSTPNPTPHPPPLTPPHP